MPDGQDVTQPLLFEELRGFGVKISSGELNKLLVEDKEGFHKEKRDILLAGINGSNYIHVDDTGARHNGRNGYCTHIGNEAFACFESTNTKNRINFLEILHCGDIRYCVDLDVVESALAHKFYYDGCMNMQAFINQRCGEIWFDKATELRDFIKIYGFVSNYQFGNIMEWSLLSSLRHRHKGHEMGIISDEAGQFGLSIFAHGLCWFHVERKIHALVPSTENQVKRRDDIRDKFWNLYYSLKEYKITPNDTFKREIIKDFDELISVETGYPALQELLKKISALKNELLLILERPEMPLHNNLSENDIKTYVKKRKISGSTRSNDGRLCRDTFASLKKTYKKQAVSIVLCKCPKVRH